MFCDNNNKKNNNNVNSYNKRNKIMIFTDLDRDFFFLGTTCIQPGDNDSFTTSPKTTSSDNKNAEYLTIQRSLNQYCTDIFNNQLMGNFLMSRHLP